MLEVDPFVLQRQLIVSPILFGLVSVPPIEKGNCSKLAVISMGPTSWNIHLSVLFLWKVLLLVFARREVADKKLTYPSPYSYLSLLLSVPHS